LEIIGFLTKNSVFRAIFNKNHYKNSDFIKILPPAPGEKRVKNIELCYFYKNLLMKNIATESAT